GREREGGRGRGRDVKFSHRPTFSHPAERINNLKFALTQVCDVSIEQRSSPTHTHTCTHACTQTRIDTHTGTLTAGPVPKTQPFLSLSLPLSLSLSFPLSLSLPLS